MNSYLSLKAGVRDLIEMAGGNVRAARVSRADRARLSRYGSPHEGMHAPIDVIADLEQETGDPAVTRVLADIAGFVLVPKCAAEGHGSFTAHLGAVAKEAGEAISTLAASMADGVMTTTEAEACLLEVQQAQARFACLERDLKQVLASAPIQFKRA